MARTTTEDKLGTEDGDSILAVFVLHGEHIEGTDGLVAEDAVEGDAAHRHPGHVLGEGVDGEYGVVLGVVDDHEEGDVLIGRVDGGDEVVGVVGDLILLDFGVKDDSF